MLGFVSMESVQSSEINRTPSSLDVRAQLSLKVAGAGSRCSAFTKGICRETTSAQCSSLDGCGSSIVNAISRGLSAGKLLTRVAYAVRWLAL